MPRAISAKWSGGCDRSKLTGKSCLAMPRSFQYWSMFNCNRRYEPLLQITNLASTLWRAADHSAWIVYMAAVAGEADYGLVRVSHFGADGAGNADAERAAARQEVFACALGRPVAYDCGRTSQRLVEEDHVLFRQAGDKFLHKAGHAQRHGVAVGLVVFEGCGAFGLGFGLEGRSAFLGVRLLCGRHDLFERRSTGPTSAWGQPRRRYRPGGSGDFVGVEVDVHGLGAGCEDVAQFRKTSGSTYVPTIRLASPLHDGQLAEPNIWPVMPR